MYTNNLQQLVNFMYFMIVGMVLGIIFDIFRILRRSFKTSDFLTNMEDILFGLIAGIILILSIFFINNGQLRFYVIIGIFNGIVLYLLFFSKHFISLNIYIISCIKKIIMILTKPFIIIFKILRKILMKPISFFIIHLKSFILKKLISVIKNTKTNKNSIEKEGF